MFSERRGSGVGGGYLHFTRTFLLIANTDCDRGEVLDDPFGVDGFPGTRFSTGRHLRTMSHQQIIQVVVDLHAFGLKGGSRDQDRLILMI